MHLGLVLIALVATATATPLEEDIDFQEGRRLVDELDYERAVFRFQKLVKSERPVEQRAAAWAWLGLTYANLGDEGEAIKAFVAAIKLDPLVVLPPSSPKVAQTFDRARKVAREELKSDGDGDGILDAQDQCLTALETTNGFNDTDGCPDEVPVAPVDGDADGVVGAADLCPTVAETKNGIDDADGCPDQATAAPEAARGPSGLFVGSVVAAGVGAVGLAAGGVFGVLATSTKEEALAARFQSDRAALATESQSQALIANVAFVGGGVLVLTGAVLGAAALFAGEP
jgi:tetratricopeptide (TPR) repeat protein